MEVHIELGQLLAWRLRMSASVGQEGAANPLIHVAAGVASTDGCLCESHSLPRKCDHHPSEEVQILLSPRSGGGMIYAFCENHFVSTFLISVDLENKEEWLASLYNYRG